MTGRQHAEAGRRQARRRGEAHLRGAETQTKLKEIGAVASPMTPEQFTQFIAAERRKWQEVVKAAGLEHAQ